MGDVNDDYTINVQDVVILINNIVYDYDINFDAADINEDTIINILEIVEVINIILNENNFCIPPINSTYNIHESLPS